MEWKTFEFNARRPGKKGELLNKNIYRCGFCSARGFSPSKKSTKCPVCAGGGSIKIQPPAVICAYCNGSGKSHLNTDLRCIICSGRGLVRVRSSQIEICLNCKGKGRERGGSLPCLICKGKGVIAKERHRQ